QDRPRTARDRGPPDARRRDPGARGRSTDHRRGGDHRGEMRAGGMLFISETKGTHMRAFVGLCLLAAVGGCDNDYPSGVPSINIDLPAPNASMKAAMPPTFTLSVDVKFFRLAPVGTCVEDACGFVAVNVDGDACNAKGAGENVKAATY